LRKIEHLQRIFGKKSLDLAQSEPPQQAVLVHLDASGLPDHIYQEYDLATIEEKLIKVMDREGLGEFDGNEVGPGETTLFMYGSDAERLFAGIEQTLRAGIHSVRVRVSKFVAVAREHRKENFDYKRGLMVNRVYYCRSLGSTLRKLSIRRNVKSDATLPRFGTDCFATGLSKTRTN
jgi:hypothetical protein